MGYPHRTWRSIKLHHSALSWSLLGNRLYIDQKAREDALLSPSIDLTSGASLPLEPLEPLPRTTSGDNG